MKRLLFTLFAIFLPLTAVSAGGEVPADIAAEAKMFIESITKTTIDNVVNNKDKQKKIDNFKNIFISNIDLDLILEHTLGRYWTNATAAEKSQISELFKDYNIYKWAIRFNEYSGQTLKITDVENSSTKGHYYVVSKVELPQGKEDPKAEEVIIRWRVFKDKDGKFKVFDIVITELSMVYQYKNDYRNIINLAKEAKTKPLDSVISELQTKVKDLKAEYKKL